MARRQTSSSTTPRSTRRSRGSSTASTSTRATSAAPARASSCRSRSTSRFSRSSSGGSRRCASAIRSTRTRTSARSTRRRSSRRSRSSSRAGRRRARRSTSPPCDLPERGYWFVPTLFTNVAQSYRIAQEEIFGPVLSVLTFRTPDEAVEKANNTPYGLSAGVWTEKGSRILWMAQRLRAGVVWANTFNRFDPDVAVRRLRSRLRPRGRPPRARAVPEVRRVSAPRSPPWVVGHPPPGVEPTLERTVATSPVDACGGRHDRLRSRRRTSSTSAARSHARSRAARSRRAGTTSPAPRARTRATPSARPARRSPAGPA